MTAADKGDRVGDRFWTTLAARVLHPVQVEIIEAMRWIDQPLSAVDLSEIVSPTFPRPHFVHHLRRLTRMRAIELAERPTPQNAATIRFRLAAAQHDDEG